MGIAMSETKLRKKAGHRSWGARGGRVPGTHVGDFMPVATRCALMSRIGSKNTAPERQIDELLLEAGLKFERHCSDLPGRPDFVFREACFAIFVDGDFWHGFRLPLWKHKLSEKWQLKIGATRDRDRRNFRRLRQAGWRVIRIWEHQIERDAAHCAEKVLAAYNECKSLRRSAR